MSADKCQLPKASVRLLEQMAAGAVVWAALHESDDYVRNGCLFSESVGIRVRVGTVNVRRVRSATLSPLYLAGLVAHEEGASGDRKLEITKAGRDLLTESALQDGTNGL